MRCVRVGGTVVAVAMLEPLAPEVGYVYYLLVLRDHRRRGLARRLLREALERFGRSGRSVVYAATESDNVPMIALLVSEGFRPVERRETGYRDGGLGAWGLRSRMRLVHGERLYGRRVDAPPEPGAARG